MDISETFEVRFNDSKATPLSLMNQYNVPEVNQEHELVLGKDGEIEFECIKCFIPKMSIPGLTDDLSRSLKIIEARKWLEDIFCDNVQKLIFTFL